MKVKVVGNSNKIIESKLQEISSEPSKKPLKKLAIRAAHAPDELITADNNQPLIELSGKNASDINIPQSKIFDAGDGKDKLRSEISLAIKEGWQGRDDTDMRKTLEGLNFIPELINGDKKTISIFLHYSFPSYRCSMDNITEEEKKFKDKFNDPNTHIVGFTNYGSKASINSFYHMLAVVLFNKSPEDKDSHTFFMVVPKDKMEHFVETLETNTAFAIPSELTKILNKS